MYGWQFRVKIEKSFFFFTENDMIEFLPLQLIVEEMKILTTVFLKPDNEKVYYPNSVLAMKPISNLYRSPEMRDVLEFAVHISISTEQINALKEKIAR